MRTKPLLLMALLQAFLTSCGSKVETFDLKCENLDQPLAIDSYTPHFSWKIKSNSSAPQAAYRIQVASSREKLECGEPDLWDTKKVQSDEQVMLPYDGAALASRQLCWWRVKVWQRGNASSNWSEPQRFGIGIFSPDTLRGEYIGAVSGEGRSALLRKNFNKQCDGTYLLHVNSLGYHEVWINGVKSGNAVLTPAVSQLDKRSLTVTYDITPLLADGENTIILWTGSGWYRPKTFKAEYEGALVRAELDRITENGTGEPVLWSDGSWTGAWSGYADPGTWRSWGFEGETIDARAVPQSLEEKDLTALDWKPVDVRSISGIAAVPQMCEICRVQETLEAASIEPYGDGKWLVDMGRIVNGMYRITLPQLKEGSEVKVHCSDVDPLHPEYENFGTGTLISSGRRDGDVFTSKFNSNVFRYLLFENLPEKPLKVEAFRMRTDYAVGGSFKCSDPDLQAIHDLVAYTMENLAFDGYMVDCASIERLGYGGDGNASTLSLQTLADVAPLYLNWMQAWNDVIRPDGGLPHTAPSPYRAGGGPYWCSFIVQAPWRTYMSYADKRPLERSYESMKKWFGYAEEWSKDGLLKRWPDTDYRAWYLGDWLAPDSIDVTAEETVDLVNNCALSQAYADMVKISELLGKDNDRNAYAEKLDRLNALIHQTFYHDSTHTYGTGTQLDMAYPLLVGAVPEECRGDVEKTLFERSSTLYKDHIGGGLVGVPVITEWATLSRNVEFIYKMLKQKDYPGYLFMIKNGATGVWESWNGRRSHLHNCYCGILSWFYQALGGIIPLAPGYKEVLVNPQIPAGLDSVTVEKETPYGTIKVSWKKIDGKPEISISTPPGIIVHRD